MNPVFRSSESLPSLHSLQSLQNESHHSSVHLLAYLSQESASTKSATSHEVNKGTLSGEPPGCQEAWWSDFIDLKPFKLRPLSNFGMDLTTGSDPMDRAQPSRPIAIPTRPRHRPPPLEVDPRIVSSRKENMVPSSAKFLPRALPSKRVEPDPSSPWYILNQFPTPPTSPLIIRRSKTNNSICKVSRKANNAPPSPAPKDYSCEQVEDRPALQVLRTKRQSSFGSLGKVFKTTSASIHCTPPPIPPLWLQPDPLNGKGNEMETRHMLQRRDTLKSRLFSIGASPKASPRNHRSGGRRLPSQPSGYSVSCHENRLFSESGRKSLVLHQNSKRMEPRSRSVSQPAQSKNKRDGVEPGTLGLSEVIPPLPLDLIIPERRTRSPTYINLYVPPWKQPGLSPTQISFPVEGRVLSAPSTPTGGKFELLDEIMHLPAFGSTHSLTAELDPFGAGEPASFFRSEHDMPGDTIEVDQATSVFYGKIGLGTGVSRKWQLAQRPVVVHHVPDIVISSSGRLEELKRRK